ncbi:GNAT family N-acetyltransferase [Chryseobacterium sp.]|uniref:GNAT family N-acetyltransferase n=1 Tax=Chryseobacterium sp. TaxID=1871047 RepID=UPI0011CCADAE|nr:GNAT family N-acetyltransferase [Chryseobacterium sp.]TXF78886.1 GNAT family N-acetyltransferase [Chryseobacterium sp.]
MKPEIIDFDPKYREDFKNLNVEWLQKYFVVEPFDEHQLSNPESEILEKGGKIYFAKVGNRIVGTASLLKEHDVYELAKMAVTDEFKGMGIGNLLMEHCIAEGRKLGGAKLILLSNRSLKPALKMYEKFGFREIPVDEETPYERCNIKMELHI